MVVSALCCSCTIETSGNGDLDGMWHLVSVDTLSGGHTANVMEKRIYWSFENNLLLFEDKTGTNGSLLLRFEHKNDTLRLFNPYIYDREGGDKPLEDPSLLLPFGMTGLEQTFKVERLSGSKMIINNNVLRLKFKKM